MSWKIDTAHTQIQFSVRHMMISKVRGQFERFSGEINLNEAAPSETTVNIQVETASINTRDPQRDTHLRSADFFNADVYPTMTFKSKRVKVLDGHHAHLTGDLTIKDITHEATLDVLYTGSAKSPWGSTSFGFAASGRINRKEWGLNWNKALETGGFLVGDDIDIEIELELIKVPEQAPVASNS
ncbi:MAG: YceI family protein [Anaerolineaceae bacterium]|nr:YceI family protein [Anaerolineaceae bacterium]